MKEAPLCKLSTLLALSALLKLLTQCNICQHTLLYVKVAVNLKHLAILDEISQ